MAFFFCIFIKKGGVLFCRSVETLENARNKTQEVTLYFLRFVLFCLPELSLYAIKISGKEDLTMKLDKCVERCMDAQGGLITAADIQQLGYNRGVLHTYTNAGLLERYECGVYVRPGTLVDDMLYLQRKYPTLVFSHESALFLHGLSERTPFSHSVTIPSSATLPRSLARVCTCFYIKPELHELGLTHLPTPFGNSVRCYDAERSICDLLRNRNRVDVESFSAAMKRYFNTSSVNHHQLADYASRLGVMNNLTPYLELLV